MNSGKSLTFIETSNFPISVINEASAKEKGGGGRPPYWEMVFWWTRKPLAGARAVIAGALLPEDYNKNNFLISLRLTDDKTPHRLNPELPNNIKEKLKEVKLLDPFAGFGSIPLEAIRLGVGDVVAVELLPTAYIFLKAILEYPKNYGSKLIKDVEKWGKWITEKLKEDPDIKELYNEDVAVYIGTWEVKCPVCGKYTPLIGNWWLARISNKKKYAYMKPKIENSNVLIEIRGKILEAPNPNIRGRPETAECLLCGSRITYIDPTTNRVYSSKNEAGNGQTKEKLEFYPKHALREYNQKLEEYLEGRINLENLKNSKARPRLLVKIKITGKDLEFEPTTEDDNEKLWRALEKLKHAWGDPDIPTEELWKYTASGGGALSIWTWGFDKFYKLFNPRQLLVLIKLVKLIREAGKRVEEEKLKEGWSREEAFRYAKAVTTYLAIALSRYINFGNYSNTWNPGSWALSKVRGGGVFAARGISMTWNWVDISPLKDPMYSWEGCIKTQINGLSYLVSAVSSSPSKVRVLMDDATSLSKLGNEKFDVIVTDPPYRDDVPYTELSDFYYVWLKRALSDNGLKPRFHGDALIYNTQWESMSPSEISYNEGRLKYFGVKESEDYYVRLMGMAFKRISEMLKEDGLIVTYFAHSSPEAWIELVEAGWRRAGLGVTKAWATATESEERVTARGKTALESSIVVVWKKRDKEVMSEYSDLYKVALERARNEMESAIKSGLTDVDVFLATMIGVLSVFTFYDKIVKYGKEFSSKDIVRESYAIATRILSGVSDSVKSPEALFYLASKAIYRRFSKLMGQVTLVSEPPIVLSSQDIIVLSYGFLGNDNKRYRVFVESRIVEELGETSGAEVAKQKAFRLLEPMKPDLMNIKEVLGRRGVDIIKLSAIKRPLNTIDILHLLEYYALQGVGEFTRVYQELYSKYPELTREAVEVAKVLRGFDGDPENELGNKVVSYIAERW